MKQGDELSQTLFELYVNDLAHEIKQADLGIYIDDMKFSILLYADDVVFVAETVQFTEMYFSHQGQFF